MIEEESDRGLLTRVAQGDRQAMRVLYERHARALRIFLRMRGGDEAAADDVLHDAMLEVWRNAARFRGDASVRTWIFTIARNRQTDRMRKSARMTLVDEVPETADDGPNAEAVLEASEDAAQVRACLGKLKDVQRVAIRLAFYEGLTYDEIAGIEAVPVGTIKSRIFHAKQALMRCLGRSVAVRAGRP